MINDDRPARVVVIGAEGLNYSDSNLKVDSYYWHSLGQIRNLGDNDFVILNLLSLDSPEELDLDEFRRVFNEQAAQRILGLGQANEGAIFVVGDPRLTLPQDEETEAEGEPILGWTGLWFQWDNNVGASVIPDGGTAEDPVLGHYISKIDSWDYSLEYCELREFAEERGWHPSVLPEDVQIAADVKNICTTRYGNPIAFSVQLVAEGVRPEDMWGPGAHLNAITGSRPRTVSTPISGPLVFLPKSSMSEEDTLSFLLQDIIGLKLSASRPEWLEEMEAPGQLSVDQEIEEIDRRAEELREERQSKLTERERVRRPLEILYQEGHALEEEVRFMLEQLGAEVAEPGEEGNMEDGWLTVDLEDETLRGVLEIKSTSKGQFNEQGVRQLTDWVNRGIDQKEISYKGIFIGNSATKEMPQDRPAPFSDSWISKARLHGHAAIRTQNLYAVYILDHMGSLDREKFWRLLFSTNGPIDMEIIYEDISDEVRQELVGLLGG